MLFLLLCKAVFSLDECQKTIVLQLTNLYEYDNAKFVFDDCKNLNDGRGFTSGIIGFCTGTGDAYDLVLKYSKTRGQTNEFQKYLPIMKTLADTESSDVSGLKGYCTAWKKACSNNVFKTAQLNYLFDQYYNPSQNLAKAIGLKLPVSFGQLYDAAVMHGFGKDYPDSLDGLLSRMNVTNPKTEAEELKWLDRFLALRKNVMCNPTDPLTKDAWCESACRVDSYSYILKNNPKFTTFAKALNNDGKIIQVNCDKSIYVSK